MSEKTPLWTRLRTHSDSMWSEGWYTVAMTMDEAAKELERLTDENARLRLAYWGELDRDELIPITEPDRP